MDANVDKDGRAKAALTFGGVYALDQFARCTTPAPAAEREHVQSRRHDIFAEVRSYRFPRRTFQMPSCPAILIGRLSSFTSLRMKCQLPRWAQFFCPRGISFVQATTFIVATRWPSSLDGTSIRRRLITIQQAVQWSRQTIRPR